MPTLIRENADAANSVATAYTMDVGDTFSGSIESAWEEDWVRVELTAGEAYTISLNGSSGADGLPDPYLQVFDSRGSRVAINDDGGLGLNSLLEYTATSNGFYYLSAKGYDGGSLGTYDITLTTYSAPAPSEVASYDALASYLTDGYWADNGSARHSFSTSGTTTVDVNITELTADGQKLARWAFEAWASVADIVFNEVSWGADINFDDTGSGAYASYSASAGATISANINVSTSWLGAYGTTIDSYSFSTYLHEIGHALGLGHQGDYNGSATYGIDETYRNDSWQASVMSYFSQSENTSISASYAAIVSPMIADILAMQTLYGVAQTGSATTGNTTYGEGSDVGGYMEQLFLALDTGVTAGIYGGRNLAYTLFDLSGTDTINFENSTSSNRLDLRGEAISDINGLTGNLVIARGTVIENAVTGSGADTITGNMANNNLNGAAGNDLLTAGGGDDTLYGDSGTDTLTGDDGNDVLYGGTGADILSGGGQADTLFGGSENDSVEGGNGIDVLNGGDGHDTMTGGNDADILRGDAGNDLMSGDGQADSLWGGDGDDTISGGNGSDSLLGGNGADLLNGGNDADVLLGDFGNDQLNGDGQADTLWGGDGDDTLFGGNGSDSLQGGSGVDLMHGGNDADILHGDSQSDVLNGDDGDDAIFGDNGFDVLNGGVGEDSLYGGNDSDTLNGGADDDILAGERQGDILNGDAGNDTLNGGVGNDTLYGGDDDDLLNGGVNNDLLNGGTGADVLNGEGQWDTLNGDAGNDSLDGGAGNDVLSGGTGDDTLTGGSNTDDFIFADGFGIDVITDFNIWDVNEDIDLSAVTAITGFADLIPAALIPDSHL